MGKSERINADINLQQFFDRVFDGSGRIAEPTGCDTALYLSMLEESDMDAEAKTELVHTLWRMMDSVIRMQFGFDSLTHVMNEKAGIRAQNDVAMVQSCSIPKTECNEET